MLSEHVISTQPLPALAVWLVQEATGAVGTVVVTQSIPLAGSTTHAAGSIAVKVTTTSHSVRWKPFPIEAAVVVHELSSTGPLTRVSGGQVVVV